MAVLGLTVTRVRAAAGGHTQLTLKRDATCSTASPSGGRPRDDVHEGDRIDVVARLGSRTFGGFESLQLEIRDAAPSGIASRGGGASSGDGRRRRSPAVPS